MKKKFLIKSLRRKSLKKSNKRSSKKSSKRNLKRRSFGTMDRRTLHEINYYNDTSGYSDVDGILLAPGAFSWENSPQDRALNAG